MPDSSVQLSQTLFVSVLIKRTVAPGMGVPSVVRTIPDTVDVETAGSCAAGLGDPISNQNRKRSESPYSCKRLDFARAGDLISFVRSTWPFYPPKKFPMATLGQESPLDSTPWTSDIVSRTGGPGRLHEHRIGVSGRSGYGVGQTIEKSKTGWISNQTFPGRNSIPRMIHFSGPYSSKNPSGKESNLKESLSSP